MAYKTIHGRRLNVPKATNGRQYLVKLEGTVATFECKAGHRITKDFSKGRPHQRMSIAALQKFAAYWGLGLQSNGVRGHVNGWCQKCQNVYDGVTK